MDRPVHVIGGGIAGLVAAITAAEAQAPVVLHEATGRVGGRALGGTDRAGVNLGPHILLSDGALVRWLKARGIRVGMTRVRFEGARMLDDRSSHFPASEAFEILPTLRPRVAPVDDDFRTWADSQFGSDRAELLCRLAGLFTFHHDPGSLSARFVWDRYRRTFLRADRVRWVLGGWTTLVDALAGRAADLGVRTELHDRVAAANWPDGPTVVATNLSTAARLLERDLTWPGGRAALLDAITRPRRGWPSLMADVRSDLTTCCMVERETAVEPGLVGPGAELFQAHLGIGPDVTVEAGVNRIEDALDRGVAGWRDELIWKRGHVVVNSTGALDPPGTTWRDRPAIDQGGDRFLAGDSVGAPGFLCEVAVNSGVRSAHLALDARRRRVYAVGWPSAALSPDRRLAVLAAVLPSPRLDQGGAGSGRSDVEPVDETGPGYRLRVRGGVVTGASATSTLVAGRWPAPVNRAVGRATSYRHR